MDKVVSTKGEVICEKEQGVVRINFPGKLRPSILGGVLLIFASAASAQPRGYYDTVDDSSPQAMRLSLHEIIDDHQRYPYTSSTTDTWDILELADENRDHENQVITIYRNVSYAKEGGVNDFYNREHSWPRSYGFPVDDPGNYPFTDAHHLFLADDDYNFSRSNKPYSYCYPECLEQVTESNNGRGGLGGAYPGDSNWTEGSFTEGVWEIWPGRRGDVARAQLYMDVRYEGGTHGLTGASEPDLILTDDLDLIDQSNTGKNESVAYMGFLSVLLQWHLEDSVDEIEMQHHEAVAGFQGNRNPFIDHPEWVKCVFGGICGGFEINAGLNGNWWKGPDRSGEGVQIEVANAGGGERVFVATVYSYDTMGNQIFLIAVGPVNGNTAVVDVFITEGGMWGHNFNPEDISETQWGTGTFTAINCDSMHMELMPNVEIQTEGYTDLEYDLVRLTTPIVSCPFERRN